MTGFTVEDTVPVDLERTSPLSGMFVLSPCVWREDDTYKLLVRAVNPSEDPSQKVARIYYGESNDGLRFRMADGPALAPSTRDDKDGCEDPTLERLDGRYYVYYSGWDETKKVGQLMLAVGETIDDLKKQGVKLRSSDTHTNPKEATLVAADDGSWRLFFEYASGASKVGVASAPAVDGPWTVQAPLFEARPGSWDSYHLSTGPILPGDTPVMFYNGADENAHWRIGWVAFDKAYAKVIGRSENPLIVPPPGEPGDTDIAFAASAVAEEHGISLYYSVADKAIFRATLKQEPKTGL